MNVLTDLADEHLGLARAAAHGRSAHLLLHDGPLRQTLIALVGGESLSDHETPGAASLLVLRGRVRLTSSDGDTDLSEGTLEAVPDERHGLTALDDAVVLLTTVTGR
ncbi:cupin [Glycomyces buryatensis]|uniref:Cupin n=1 Tax=Glycomyces buryatensis TaxID=2570927 RepID=A0A4S8Q7Y1_9ACTN|nr:cupin [Glycomyces buryatensis]THV36434.1 cupin [Glycomyces buryatensis]